MEINLLQFIGGQFEWQKPLEWCYRGEISNITTQGDSIIVHFAWVAKMIKSGWTETDKPTYEIKPETHCFQSLSNDNYGKSRLMVYVRDGDELGVFFSPGGSTLKRPPVKQSIGDKAVVQGKPEKAG